MDKPDIPFVDPYVAKRMKKMLQEEQNLLEEEMKKNIRNKKEALRYLESEQELKQNNKGTDSEPKDPESSPSMVG